jgi:hypothetical protein
VSSRSNTPGYECDDDGVLNRGPAGGEPKRMAGRGIRTGDPF